MRVRRVLGRAVLVAVLLVGAGATPVGAQRAVPAPPTGPRAYLAMFDDADLPGVVELDAGLFDALFSVTGDPATDARIRAAAEARGYRPRPVAAAALVTVDGHRLQPAAADAWLALREAAAADGVSLRLTSGFRDAAGQRSLFRARLGGSVSDAAIESALRTASPPGFSKHHTGYAIDVADAAAGGAGFASTAGYEWLRADDFANARRHGFVPSYPEAGGFMGPDPESWEFVWVGGGRIGCVEGADGDRPFCDTVGGVHDDDIEWLGSMGVTVGCAPGRYCTDDPVTRGEAATMLWRLHGAPDPAGAAPFVDVYPTDHFATAVDWLWGAGITTGTGPVTFSPDDHLDSEQLLTLLVRLDHAPSLPAPTGLTGVVPPSPAARAAVPGLVLSRGEFAAVLRATAAQG